MLKDILGKYMREVQGMEFYATDRGFAIYKIKGEELFIEAMAMADDSQKKETNDFLEVIFSEARDLGCKIVTGNVNMTKERATERLFGHIKRGYKVAGNDGIYTLMYKEL